MSMKVREIPVRYRNRSQEQRDAEKKVVTGAGVTGAAVQVNRSKKAFDMFASSKKLTQLSGDVADVAKKVNTVAKQSTGLMAKVSENFGWAKAQVLKWGSQFKNLKYIKPLVESAPFRGVASLAGLGFGAVTFISGAAEIAKAASNIKDAA